MSEEVLYYPDLLKFPSPQVPSDLVPHPRFGSGPIKTDFIPNERADILYHYHPADVWPDTAIPADPDIFGQSVTITFYLDQLRYCVDCKRPFIFHAEEQRHWYEELKFPPESTAERCFPCRKAHRTTPNPQREFNKYYNQENLNPQELEILIEATLDLWNQTAIKNPKILQKVAESANKSNPNSPQLSNLCALIESTKK